MVGRMPRKRQPRRRRADASGCYRNSFFQVRNAANAATSSARGCPAWRAAAARTDAQARAQERVGGTLQRDRRWQRGFAALPLRPFVRDARRHVGVGGFDRECEAKVRERVLVPAVNARRIGQARERAERRPHLRRRALEQAPAAGGEQRVAAEHAGMAVHVAEQRDVTRRVARDVERAQRHRESRHRDHVALRERLRAPGNRLARRSVHRHREAREQRRNAARRGRRGGGSRGSR